MVTFLLTTATIMLALGLVSYISGKRADHRAMETSEVSLLPEDIKYESPSGGFVFYFPIATSVVISPILSLLLYVLTARVIRANRELATNPTSAKPLTTQNTWWWPVAPGDWSSR